jgi:hypothetical protein
MKKVCPNCGSSEIDYASLQTGSGEMVGIGLQAKYYCPKCGYCGSVILEMNEKQRNESKFSKQIYHSGHHRSVEAMKPVFTMTLILFMITAVVLLVPKYEINKEPSVVSPDTSHSITYLPVRVSDSIMGGNYTYTIIEAENTQAIISSVDSALGLMNVSGFLVPAFFLFFVSGMITLMIMNHYRRAKIFR